MEGEWRGGEREGREGLNVVNLSEYFNCSYPQCLKITF